MSISEGQCDFGREGVFDADRRLVFKPGAGVALAAPGPAGARVIRLGGEPMESPRYLSWNFVSSSAERIEQARADWQNGLFPQVPGETEFIPLPATGGRPVHYP